MIPRCLPVVTDDVDFLSYCAALPKTKYDAEDNIANYLKEKTVNFFEISLHYSCKCDTILWKLFRMV